MNIDLVTITALMRAVRTKSPEARDELEELAHACVDDLDQSGVYVTSCEDPRTLQALKLYAKANYGYDSETDTRRFQTGYEALKRAMALSGDYPKGE